MRPATLIVVFCYILTCSTACTNHSHDNPSLTDLHPGVNPNVENGTAFDKADVWVGNAKTVVLPDDDDFVRTEVTGTAGDGWVRVYMAKELRYVGHPPERMSIRDLRKEMGCVTRFEGDTLIIQPYGAWESKEGGATIRLLAQIPRNLKVQRRRLAQLHVVCGEPDSDHHARK